MLRHLLLLKYVQADAEPQPRVLRCVVRELEDPRKMLDQAVADMQADLIKMRQAAAQARSQSPALLSGLPVVSCRGEAKLNKAPLLLRA